MLTGGWPNVSYRPGGPADAAVDRVRGADCRGHRRAGAGAAQSLARDRLAPGSRGRAPARLDLLPRQRRGDSTTSGGCADFDACQCATRGTRRDDRRDSPRRSPARTTLRRTGRSRRQPTPSSVALAERRQRGSDRRTNPSRFRTACRRANRSGETLSSRARRTGRVAGSDGSITAAQRSVHRSRDDDRLRLVGRTALADSSDRAARPRSHR